MALIKTTKARKIKARHGAALSAVKGDYIADLTASR